MAKVKESSTIETNDANFKSLATIMKDKYDDGLFDTDVGLGVMQTGFPLIDYGLGFGIDIYEGDEWKEREVHKGVLEGSYMLIVGQPASGKAQPMSTKIPTPYGYITMGEIVVGCIVFNRRGMPVHVTGVFDQGKKTVYEVTFNDGRKTICCGEHLWTVKKPGEKWKTVQLLDILDDYQEYYIPNNEAAEFKSRRIIINPFELGKTIGRNSLVTECESIPNEYIYNSKYARWNIINGITEAIGHVNEDGTIKIKTPDSSLLNQIKYILHSLGYLSTIVNNELFFNIHDRGTIVGISNIKEIGVEECRCIMVDDAEHLYLTDDFIVTHNTTLATQMAANIIRPYKLGMVEYFDLERATITSHVMDITRLPRSDFDKENPSRRWIHSQQPADHEMIQKTILRIYKEKMTNREKYEIKLNQRDGYGNPIVTMQPTVVVIDSIPMIGSTLELGVAKDERKMEEALTQMDAAQTAGAFKRMMKMILGPMKQANIIVIGISHIGTKISSNPMIPNKKDFRALGQDEIISGGKMNTYGATNIIKTDRRGGKGYTVENGDGFNGFDSAITVVKSRTTFDAKVIPMIYDCDYGFDNVRSLIQYGIEHGIITGNRASMKFTADPDCKFSYVKLYEEIAKKPEIVKNISEHIIPTLEEPFKKKDASSGLMNIFFEY